MVLGLTGTVAGGSEAATYQARKRVGAEPVARLVEEVAVPLAAATTKGAWLSGWRLMSIDGTTLDLAGHREPQAPARGLVR